jgi:hypothetical protein
MCGQMLRVAAPEARAVMAPVAFVIVVAVVVVILIVIRIVVVVVGVCRLSSQSVRMGVKAILASSRLGPIVEEKSFVQESPCSPGSRHGSRMHSFSRPGHHQSAL